MIIVFLVRLIIELLIIGLFLYSKLAPYKDRLAGQFKGIFEFFSNLFEPILRFLKKYLKPYQVGQGLWVDMSQVLLLVLLLILLKLV